MLPASARQPCPPPMEPRPAANRAPHRSTLLTAATMMAPGEHSCHCSCCLQEAAAIIARVVTQTDQPRAVLHAGLTIPRCTAARPPANSLPRPLSSSSAASILGPRQSPTPGTHAQCRRKQRCREQLVSYLIVCTVHLARAASLLKSAFYSTARTLLMWRWTCGASTPGWTSCRPRMLLTHRRLSGCHSSTTPVTRSEPPGRALVVT